MKKGEIKTGLDGKKYMVFNNEEECLKYAPEKANFACFNGWMNAYEVGETNDIHR